jgi:hypothetical protein
MDQPNSTFQPTRWRARLKATLGRTPNPALALLATPLSGGRPFQGREPLRVRES